MKKSFLAAATALCLLLAFSAPGQVPDSVGLTPVFDPLQIPLKLPLYFNEMPGRPGTYILLEQHEGRVALVRRENQQWVKEEFLKIPVNTYSPEMGLLGFAFHPDFRNNRKYYINYNPPDSETVIEERVAATTFLRDAGDPPRVVLRFDQPFGYHNGGSLEFGPDSYLYIGTGDGGGAGDPNGNAQNLNTLLGKMLRIDVDKKQDNKEYAVPADNPFQGRADARPEIWALGLRNPWKYSFDATTGELWLGDVGQYAYEEISIPAKGDNLGWKVVEANHCFSPYIGCDKSGYAAPVLEYGRVDGNCIVGGYVFRGDPSSGFYGWYIFGDFGSRKIWALKRENGIVTKKAQVALLPSTLSSFGSDAQGNIYAVGHLNGTIYRLVSPEMKPMGVKPAQRRAISRRVHSVDRGSVLDLRGLDLPERIDLLSVKGRMVRSAMRHNGRLSVSSVEPGLYFLRGTGQARPIHLVAVR